MDQGAMTGAISVDLYFLRCITNLHAGTGGINYGIVDKEVQRDAIDEMPIIHSSSLKGAFREQLETLEVLKPDEIVRIFGTDSKAGVPAPDWNAGQYYFYEAEILFYPVRSNLKPFYYATSHALVKKLLRRLEDLQISQRNAIQEAFAPILAESPAQGFPLQFEHGGHRLLVDEFVATEAESKIPGFRFRSAAAGEMGKIPVITKDNLLLFHDNDMKDICKRLPVMARNRLDNGISTNLWYEEVVPRESIFHFCISRPSGSDLFEIGLNSSKVNHQSQIGGGASVGYGLCGLNKFSQ